MQKKVEDNGLVSVIIPVYQAEKYIERCVKSVIDQTYRKIEIILIDDGSRDSSLRICYELAQRDERIKVLHQKNSGAAVARNKGLDCASGEFVLFLDSDDWIDKGMLSDMLDKFNIDDVDMSICGFFYVNHNGTQECGCISDTKVSQSEFMSRFFWQLYNSAILFNIGTKIYKRSIIEENNLRFCTDMVVYEDICFCLDYIKKTRDISMSDKSYYYYFQGNANSITHAYKEDFWRSTCDFCNILVDDFRCDSPEFGKAILVCLYRAYLQECQAPTLKMSEFYSKILKIQSFCRENKGLKRKWLLDLSLDQRVFLRLIIGGHKFLLWMLAIGISMKKK